MEHPANLHLRIEIRDTCRAAFLTPFFQNTKLALATGKLFSREIARNDGAICVLHSSEGLDTNFLEPTSQKRDLGLAIHQWPEVLRF